MKRTDGTDHYGVNVTLVTGEGLNAVGAPDVPQLGRGVARARHKRFLQHKCKGLQGIDCRSKKWDEVLEIVSLDFEPGLERVRETSRPLCARQMWSPGHITRVMIILC